MNRLLLSRIYLRCIIPIFCTVPFTSCAASRAEQPPQSIMDITADHYFSKKMQADFVETVGQGEVAKAKLLLDDGADVNAVGSEGMTALYWAMLRRQYGGFQFLLENGADPNTLTRWSDSDGQEQWASAIAVAVKLEDLRYLVTLLDAGANANLIINSSNQTAIYQVILHRRYESLTILLDHGADINHRTVSSNTPIAEAVNMRAYTMALALLRAGADPTIKDKSGFSAVDTTRKFGNAGTIVGSEDERAYIEFVDELRSRGFWDR